MKLKLFEEFSNISAAKQVFDELLKFVAWLEPKAKIHNREIGYPLDHGYVVPRELSRDFKNVFDQEGEDIVRTSIEHIEKFMNQLKPDQDISVPTIDPDYFGPLIKLWIFRMEATVGRAKITVFVYFNDYKLKAWGKVQPSAKTKLHDKLVNEKEIERAKTLIEQVNSYQFADISDIRGAALGRDLRVS